MIQLVLEGIHHFCKTFFQEHFQENEGFLEILKEVFRIYFTEFSLPIFH